MPGDTRNSHVVADVQRMFAPVADRSFARAVDRDPEQDEAAESPRRRDRKFLLAAPILVVIAGVALASVYIGADIVPPRPASQTVAALPSADPGGETGFNSAAQPDSAAPIVQEAGPLQPDTAAQPALPLKDAGKTARPFGASDIRSPGSGRAPASAGNPAPGGGATTRSRVECEDGSLEDHCIYQDVLNADNRLRGAFARARRSGVSSDRLTAIQRRWTRAREDAETDPDGTIRRYDQLADLLDQERAEVE